MSKSLLLAIASGLLTSYVSAQGSVTFTTWFCFDPSSTPTDDNITELLAENRGLICPQEPPAIQLCARYPACFEGGIESWQPSQIVLCVTETATTVDNTTTFTHTIQPDSVCETGPPAVPEPPAQGAMQLTPAGCTLIVDAPACCPIENYNIGVTNFDVEDTYRIEVYADPDDVKIKQSTSPYTSGGSNGGILQPIIGLVREVGAVIRPGI